ncbi:MAG: EAL domain-containing protein [Terrimicrobiaceae bacterium]|nr:EAL domain-containing protein [Terrimicrobiaceae bacterium]
MPFPVLQNETVRKLVLVLAAAGALVAVIGSATLSYRQTRAQAVQGLEQKSAVWQDAVAILLSGARAKLRFADEATRGEASHGTVEVLSRLVAESAIYRGALLVREGRLVSSYVTVLDPPIEAPPELLELGPIGDVHLARVPGTVDRAPAIAVNYNTGKNYSLSVLLPVPGVSELMRFGDRHSRESVFLVGPNGEILDGSLNWTHGAAPPAGRPVAGLSETEHQILFSRQIPGYPIFVTAVLPKSVLFELWSENIPVYATVAVALAGCFFVGAWLATLRTRSLEAELREAARLRQIVPYYQPVIDLRTGTCAGVEVLMRWRHPGRGLIPPAQFIPEAERTGVITALTEALMVQTVEELADIFAERPDLHAAINIPVQTLTNPTFPAHVTRLFKRRLKFGQIYFELTESTSLTESATVQLRAMKDLGIRLAVDDFGTGYSNLRYLSVFPFDFLKIDKAFVDGISLEGRSSGLVDHIVSIGRTCGLQLIAEGIEHAAQADYLRKLGVEFGQGYLFAAPMPIGSLREWLKATTSPFESPLSTREPEHRGH